MASSVVLVALSKAVTGIVVYIAGSGSTRQCSNLGSKVS